MTASATDWPLQALQSQIAPLLPGFEAQAVAQIDSTSTELMRRLRAGDTASVLLVAERQTAGRGRLGRSWHSDQAPEDTRGSLTFSIALPLSPSDWSGLSLAIGVGAARALHPALRLKWPNDLWLHDRKLAGILVETAVFGTRRFAVIGMGVNIGPRAGGGLSTPPAWLQELLPEVDAPQALLRLAPALVQSAQLFEKRGFVAFRDAFSERDALDGRAVRLSDGTEGVAAGVDDSGAIMVSTASGLQRVASAEVSVRPVASAGPDAPAAGGA